MEAEALNRLATTKLNFFKINDVGSLQCAPSKSVTVLKTGNLVFSSTFCSILEKYHFEFIRSEMLNLLESLGATEKLLNGVNYIIFFRVLFASTSVFSESMNSYIRSSAKYTLNESISLIKSYSVSYFERLRELRHKNDLFSPKNLEVFIKDDQILLEPEEILKNIRVSLENAKIDLRSAVMNSFGDLDTFVSIRNFHCFLFKKLNLQLKESQFEALFNGLSKEKSRYIRISEFIKAYYTDLSPKTFKRLEDEDRVLVDDFETALNESFDSIQEIKRVLKFLDPIIISDEEFRAFAKSFTAFTEDSIQRIFKRLIKDPNGFLSSADIFTLFHKKTEETDLKKEVGHFLDQDFTKKGSSEQFEGDQKFLNDNVDVILTDFERGNFWLTRIYSILRDGIKKRDISFQQLFSEFTENNQMGFKQFVNFMNEISEDQVKISSKHYELIFFVFKNYLSQKISNRTFQKMINIAASIDPLKYKILWKIGRNGFEEFLAKFKDLIAQRVSEDLSNFMEIEEFSHFLWKFHIPLDKKDLEFAFLRGIISKIKGKYHIDISELHSLMILTNSALEEQLLSKSANYILYRYKRSLKSAEGIKKEEKVKEIKSQPSLKISKNKKANETSKIQITKKPTNQKEVISSKKSNPDSLKIASIFIDEILNRVYSECSLSEYLKKTTLNMIRRDQVENYFIISNQYENKIGQTDQIMTQTFCQESCFFLDSSMSGFKINFIQQNEGQIAAAVKNWSSEKIIASVFNQKSQKMFVLYDNLRIRIFRLRLNSFCLETEHIFHKGIIDQTISEKLALIEPAKILSFSFPLDKFCIVNFTVFGDGIFFVDTSSNIVSRQIKITSEEISLYHEIYLNLSKIASRSQFIQTVDSLFENNSSFSHFGAFLTIESLKDKISETFSVYESQAIIDLLSSSCENSLKELFSFQWKQIKQTFSSLQIISPLKVFPEQFSGLTKQFKENLLAIKKYLDLKGKSLNSVFEIYTKEKKNPKVSLDEIRSFFKEALQNVSDDLQKKFWLFLAEKNCQILLSTFKMLLDEKLVEEYCNATFDRNNLSLVLNKAGKKGINMANILVQFDRTNNNTVLKRDMHEAFNQLSLGLTENEIEAIIAQNFSLQGDIIHFDYQKFNREYILAAQSPSDAKKQDLLQFSLIFYEVEYLIEHSCILATTSLPRMPSIYLFEANLQRGEDEKSNIRLHYRKRAKFQSKNSKIPQLFALIEEFNAFIAWNDLSFYSDVFDGKNKSESNCFEQLYIYKLDSLQGLSESISPSKIIIAERSQGVLKSIYLSRSQLIAVLCRDKTVRFYDPIKMNINNIISESIRTISPGVNAPEITNIPSIQDIQEVKRIYFGEKTPIDFFLCRKENYGEINSSENKLYQNAFYENLILFLRDENDEKYLQITSVNRIKFTISYNNKNKPLPAKIVAQMSDFSKKRNESLRKEIQLIDSEKQLNMQKIDENFEKKKMDFEKGFKKLVISKFRGCFSTNDFKKCESFLLEYLKNNHSTEHLYYLGVVFGLFKQENLSFSEFETLVAQLKVNASVNRLRQYEDLEEFSEALKINTKLLKSLMKMPVITLDDLKRIYLPFAPPFKRIDLNQIVQCVNPYSKVKIPQEMFQNFFKNEILENKLKIFARGTQLAKKINKIYSKTEKIGLLQKLLSTDSKNQQLLSFESFEKVFQGTLPKNEENLNIFLSSEDLEELFLFHSKEVGKERFLDLPLFCQQILNEDEECQLERIYFVLAKVKSVLTYTNRSLKDIFAYNSIGELSKENFTKSIKNLFDFQINKIDEEEIELLWEFLSTSNLNSTPIVEYSIFDAYLSKLDSRLLSSRIEDWDLLRNQINQILNSTITLQLQMPIFSLRDFKLFLKKFDFLDPFVRDYLFVKFGKNKQETKSLFAKLKTFMRELEIIQNKDSKSIEQLFDKKDLKKENIFASEMRIIEKISEIIDPTTNISFFDKINTVCKSFKSGQEIRISTFLEILYFNTNFETSEKIIEFENLLARFQRFYNVKKESSYIKYEDFSEHLKNFQLKSQKQGSIESIEQILKKISEQINAEQIDLRKCLEFFDEKETGLVNSENFERAIQLSKIELSSDSFGQITVYLTNYETGLINYKKLFEKIDLIERNNKIDFDWQKWRNCSSRLSKKLKMKLLGQKNKIESTLRHNQSIRGTNLISKGLFKELMLLFKDTFDSSETRIIFDYASRGSDSLSKNNLEFINIDYFLKSFAVLNDELGYIELPSADYAEVIDEIKELSQPLENLCFKMKNLLTENEITIEEIMGELISDNSDFEHLSRENWTLFLQLIRPEKMTLRERTSLTKYLMKDNKILKKDLLKYFSENNYKKDSKKKNDFLLILFGIKMDIFEYSWKKIFTELRWTDTIESSSKSELAKFLSERLKIDNSDEICSIFFENNPKNIQELERRINDLNAPKLLEQEFLWILAKLNFLIEVKQISFENEFEEIECQNISTNEAISLLLKKFNVQLNSTLLNCLIQKVQSSTKPEKNKNLQNFLIFNEILKYLSSKSSKMLSNSQNALQQIYSALKQKGMGILEAFAIADIGNRKSLSFSSFKIGLNQIIPNRFSNILEIWNLFRKDSQNTLSFSNFKEEFVNAKLLSEMDLKSNKASITRNIAFSMLKKGTVVKVFNMFDAANKNKVDFPSFSSILKKMKIKVNNQEASLVFSAIISAGNGVYEGTPALLEDKNLFFCYHDFLNFWNYYLNDDYINQIVAKIEKFVQIQGLKWTGIIDEIEMERIKKAKSAKPARKLRIEPKKKELKKMLNTLHFPLSKEEIEVFLELFKNKTVKLEEIEALLKERLAFIAQKKDKVCTITSKIISSVQQFCSKEKAPLEAVFNEYCNKSDSKMGIAQFEQIFKKMQLSFNKLEIRVIFDVMDYEGKKSISFHQFQDLFGNSQMTKYSPDLRKVEKLKEQVTKILQDRQKTLVQEFLAFIQENQLQSLNKDTFLLFFKSFDLNCENSEILNLRDEFFGGSQKFDMEDLLLWAFKNKWEEIEPEAKEAKIPADVRANLWSILLSLSRKGLSVEDVSKYFLDCKFLVHKQTFLEFFQYFSIQLTENDLARIWNYFDKKKVGYVTKENFIKLFENARSLNMELQAHINKISARHWLRILQTKISQVIKSRQYSLAQLKTIFSVQKNSEINRACFIQGLTYIDADIKLDKVNAFFDSILKKSRKCIIFEDFLNKLNETSNLTSFCHSCNQILCQILDLVFHYYSEFIDEFLSREFLHQGINFQFYSAMRTEEFFCLLEKNKIDLSPGDKDILIQKYQVEANSSILDLSRFYFDIENELMNQKMKKNCEKDRKNVWLKDLSRAIMKFLVQNGNNFEKLISSLDPQKSGLIEKEIFMNMMCSLDIKLSLKEVEIVCSYFLDEKDSAKISSNKLRNEFLRQLSALTPPVSYSKLESTTQRLLARFMKIVRDDLNLSFISVFDQICNSQIGFFTLENLIDFCRKKIIHFTQQEIGLIFASMDAKKNSIVDQFEFASVYQIQSCSGIVLEKQNAEREVLSELAKNAKIDGFLANISKSFKVYDTESKGHLSLIEFKTFLKEEFQINLGTIGLKCFAHLINPFRNDQIHCDEFLAKISTELVHFQNEEKKYLISPQTSKPEKFSEMKLTQKTSETSNMKTEVFPAHVAYKSTESVIFNDESVELVRKKQIKDSVLDRFLENLLYYHDRMEKIEDKTSIFEKIFRLLAEIDSDFDLELSVKEFGDLLGILNLGNLERGQKFRLAALFSSSPESISILKIMDALDYKFKIIFRNPVETQSPKDEDVNSNIFEKLFNGLDPLLNFANIQNDCSSQLCHCQNEIGRNESGLSIIASKMQLEMIQKQNKEIEHEIHQIQSLLSKVSSTKQREVSIGYFVAEHLNCQDINKSFPIFKSNAHADFTDLKSIDVSLAHPKFTQKISESYHRREGLVKVKDEKKKCSVRIYGHGLLEKTMSSGICFEEMLLNLDKAQKFLSNLSDNEFFFGSFYIAREIDSFGKKTVMIFEEAPEEKDWISLKNFIESNGGILRNPQLLLSNSIVHIFWHIFGEFSRIISTLHKNNMNLLSLDPSNIYIHKRTLKLKLQNLEFGALFDKNEEIKYLPEVFSELLSPFQEKFTNIKDIQEIGSSPQSDTYLLGKIMHFFVLGEVFERKGPDDDSVFRKNLFSDIAQFDYGLRIKPDKEFRECAILNSFAGELKTIYSNCGLELVHSSEETSDTYLKTNAMKDYCKIDENAKILDVLSLCLDKNELNRPRIESFLQNIRKSEKNSPYIFKSPILSQLFDIRASSKIFFDEIFLALFDLAIYILNQNILEEHIRIVSETIEKINENLQIEKNEKNDKKINQETLNNNFVSFLVKFQVLDLLLFCSLQIHHYFYLKRTINSKTRIAMLFPQKISSIFKRLIALMENPKSIALNYAEEIMILISKFFSGESGLLLSLKSNSILQIFNSNLLNNISSNYSDYPIIKNQFDFLTAEPIGEDLKKTFNSSFFKKFFSNRQFFFLNCQTREIIRESTSLIQTLLSSSGAGSYNFLNFSHFLSNQFSFQESNSFLFENRKISSKIRAYYDFDYFNTFLVILSVYEMLSTQSVGFPTLRVNLSLLDSISSSKNISKLNALIDSKILGKIALLIHHQDISIREVSLNIIFQICSQILNSKENNEISGEKQNSKLKMHFAETVKQFGMASHIINLAEAKMDTDLYLECLAKNHNPEKIQFLQKQFKILSYFLASEIFTFGLLKCLRSSAELFRNKQKILQISSLLCQLPSAVIEKLSIGVFNYWTILSHFLVTRKASLQGNANCELEQLALLVFEKICNEKRPDLLWQLKSIPYVCTILNDKNILLPEEVEDSHFARKLFDLKAFFNSKLLKSGWKNSKNPQIFFTDLCHFKNLITFVIDDILYNLKYKLSLNDSNSVVMNGMRQICQRIWEDMQEFLPFFLQGAFISVVSIEIINKALWFIFELFDFGISWYIFNEKTISSSIKTVFSLLTEIMNFYDNMSVEEDGQSHSKNKLILYAKNRISSVGVKLIETIIKLLNLDNSEIDNALFQARTFDFLSIIVKKQFLFLKLFMNYKVEDLSVIDYYVEEVNVRFLFLHETIRKNGMNYVKTLIDSKLIEFILETLLTDEAEFDFRYLNLAEKYLPFKTFQPFRNEALWILKVFIEKYKESEMFQMFLTDKLFQNGTMDAEFTKLTHNKASLLTSMGFFNVLLRLGNKRIKFFLKSMNIQKTLQNVFDSNKIIQTAFPSMEVSINEMS